MNELWLIEAAVNDKKKKFKKALRVKQHTGSRLCVSAGMCVCSRLTR